MPDDLIRSIPLIERYSRHNEAEDERFRIYLKGHLNLSTKKLDAIVQETTDRVWKQIDCTTCANCCRTMQVIVDNDDIKRLAARSNMTVKDFTERYVSRSEDNSTCFSSSPCPFLGEDNRCTVYEDRPKACKDFPYLYEEHFTSRSWMMMDNTALCPIVFNVWQDLKLRFKPRRRR